TERQHVERRHQLMQHLDRSSGEFEHFCQRDREFGGRELEIFLEHLDHPAIRRARLHSGFLDAGRRQDFATRKNVVGRVHWIVPANSNTGRYISTTMTPITTPIKAISKGSNS